MSDNATAVINLRPAVRLLARFSFHFTRHKSRSLFRPFTGSETLLLEKPFGFVPFCFRRTQHSCSGHTLLRYYVGQQVRRKYFKKRFSSFSDTRISRFPRYIFRPPIRTRMSLHSLNSKWVLNVSPLHTTARTRRSFHRHLTNVVPLMVG